MELINFDELVQKPKFNNDNPYMPQFQFRLLVVGGSGTGKTNAILNILTQFLNYDEVYIFLKDPYEDKYQIAVEFFEGIKQKRKKQKDVNGKSATFNYLISNNLEDVPDPNEFVDMSKQRIFLFDDMLTERDQKVIEEIAIRGRKRNISLIYLAHRYHDIPKLIRQQSNYIMLFRTTKDQMIQYFKTFGERTDKDVFYKMYKYATSETYSFLFIDLVTNDPELMFRKGFFEVGLLEKYGGMY